MGSQAGTFFFDMRPTTGERIALAASLQSSTTDRISVHAEPGVVMAGARCNTSAGSTITWDGRLDNRDDLLLQLGEVVDSEAQDEVIARAVVRRWGIEGLRRLVGEWSIAIWDGTTRTLRLARDYVGARPLYYCAGERSVMWSSSLAELVDRSGRNDALSEEFIAAFMTHRQSSRHTPYRGVHAVPGATCVTFAAETGRAETRRTYWMPGDSVIRYRDARQYEEHLRSLWAEAVGVRLRLNGTVWAELSGGLDSSSVVCMADTLIRRGVVDASNLRTISHVTLESPEGDERRFIAEVEARTGVRSEIIGVEAHQDLIDDSLAWVTPCCSQGAGLATVRQVLERGGRVILSGHFGDNVMGCEFDNSVAVWDDFADGRWLRALANIRLWSRSTRKPFWEVAGHVARVGLSSRVAQVTTPGFDGLSMLTPPLRRVAPDDRAIEVRSIRASMRELAASVVQQAHRAGLDAPIRPPGITYAYPFLHRPLVEFALAIPGEELSAPGQTRALMRRAFEGLVPSRILRRISKGYYPPALTRAARLCAAAARPVDRLEVVERGWVDGAALDRAIGLLIDGGSAGREVRQVLRLEDWLESRRRRAPAAIPQRKEVTRDEVLNA